MRQSNLGGFIKDSLVSEYPMYSMKSSGSFEPSVLSLSFGCGYMRELRNVLRCNQSFIKEGRTLIMERYVIGRLLWSRLGSSGRDDPVGTKTVLSLSFVFSTFLYL